MDLKALLLKLLGLAETATDEEIAAAAEKAASALAAPDIDLEPLAARLDSLERDAIVQRATLDGKVIPLSAEALAALPLATLRDMTAALPAGQVPTAARTQAGPAPSQLKALSAEDKEVARQLGIPEAEFLKL